MVRNINIADWAKLFLALIAFFGPGLAITSLFQFSKKLDRAYYLLISGCMSISVWSILLIWFQLFNFHINQLFTICFVIAGWAFFFIREYSQKGNILSRVKSILSLDQLLLWSVLLGSFLVGLWSIRHFVAGAGSDSYHHTLFAQMIFEHGIIPHDLLEVAPIITFSYHFGYHGIIAEFAWLTQITTRLLVVLSGPFLITAAALSTAFLTSQVTKNRIIPALSASIPGLIFVFPTQMLTWGRFPQLLGLVILATLLGMFFMWHESGYHSNYSPMIILLSTGLGLVHYRVTIMGVIAILVWFTIQGVTRHIQWTEFLPIVKKCMIIAGSCFALILPWIFNIYFSHKLGYPVIQSPVDASYYSLGRAVDINQDPNTIALLILTIIAISIGMFTRQYFLIWTTGWMVLMLALSRPPFAGTFMDTVSVIISFYIPIAISIGILLENIFHIFSNFKVIRNICLALAWAIFVILGVRSLVKITDPQNMYITQKDIETAEWIQANTPQNALFMVNTFHFPFLTEYVIGPDGGYWLPLLAHRKTVTIPMTYDIERFSEPDYMKRVVQLDQLNGKLDTDKAISLLKSDGVNYLYIGDRGGPIDPNEILKSPFFKLVHQNGNTYVFRFLVN